ncbi:MAG: CopD family protein [Gammaproteobacteria bacterium]
MQASPWELAVLACKFFTYVGLAGTAGCGLVLGFYYDGSRRMLRFLLSYGLVAALIGFQAVLVNFLIQVGMINSQGLAGMFDWTMATILLDTAQGDSTLLRLLGFAVLITTLAFALWRSQSLSATPSMQFRLWILRPAFLALLIIAVSFRLIGHVSVHGALAQLAITLHSLAFALWVGALLPLLLLCRWQSADSLPLLMRRFGDQAMVIVAVLLASGIGLLIALLNSPLQLLTTSYGQALAIKIGLVGILLGLAALNRFVLVPKLLQPGTNIALRRAIKMEMLMATLILLLTAFLSTLVGPMSASMA